MLSVYTLPRFLSAMECQQARAMFPDTQPTKPLPTGGVRRVLRSERGLFAGNTEERRALVEKIRKLLHRANDMGMRFDIDAGLEPLQLIEYRPSDICDWCLDLAPGHSTRKLSISIQLSPPDAYDGGELELWNAPPAEKAQGTAIIYPSYLVHRVRQVTRGVRVVLAGWAGGVRPLR